MSRLPAAPLPRTWSDHVQRAWLSAIALAHRGMTVSRSWCADSPLERMRLAGELAELRSRNALLERQLRLLLARFERVPPLSRPHYTPAERLEILAIKSATGWTAAELSREFLVTSLTIARWLGRLDEKGALALLALRAPVNRFPDFVAELVRELRASCPAMGKVRIAQLLARAGLHLAPSSVARFLKQPLEPKPPAPECSKSASGHTVVARYPSHVWGIDHSMLPTGVGFWVPWFPSAVIPVWPFCFWLSVVIDHFSRRVLAIGVTLGAPSAAETCKLLNRARRRARRAPKCIVTDQGVQFRREYRTWCQRRGVEPRYGAVGKHGSIALVERFWRSMKGEAFGARRRLVPLSLRQMVTLSERYVAWYNESRPHQGLAGQTPREAFERARPLHEQPRFEPRARYPDGAPCAAPLAPVRGAPGERLSLVVRHPTGLPHLPVIELRAA